MQRRARGVVVLLLLLLVLMQLHGERIGLCTLREYCNTPDLPDDQRPRFAFPSTDSDDCSISGAVLCKLRRFGRDIGQKYQALHYRTGLGAARLWASIVDLFKWLRAGLHRAGIRVTRYVVTQVKGGQDTASRLSKEATHTSVTFLKAVWDFVLKGRNTVVLALGRMRAMAQWALRMGMAYIAGAFATAYAWLTWVGGAIARAWNMVCGATVTLRNTALGGMAWGYNRATDIVHATANAAVSLWHLAGRALTWVSHKTVDSVVFMWDTTRNTLFWVWLSIVGGVLSMARTAESSTRAAGRVIKSWLIQPIANTVIAAAREIAAAPGRAWNWLTRTVELFVRGALQLTLRFFKRYYVESALLNLVTAVIGITWLVRKWKQRGRAPRTHPPTTVERIVSRHERVVMVTERVSQAPQDDTDMSRYHHRPASATPPSPPPPQPPSSAPSQQPQRPPSASIVQPPLRVSPVQRPPSTPPTPAPAQHGGYSAVSLQSHTVMQRQQWAPSPSPSQLNGYDTANLQVQTASLQVQTSTQQQQQPPQAPTPVANSLHGITSPVSFVAGIGQPVVVYGPSPDSVPSPVDFNPLAAVGAQSPIPGMTPIGMLYMAAGPQVQTQTPMQLQQPTVIPSPVRAPASVSPPVPPAPTTPVRPTTTRATPTPTTATPPPRRSLSFTGSRVTSARSLALDPLQRGVSRIGGPSRLSPDPRTEALLADLVERKVIPCADCHLTLCVSRSTGRPVCIKRVIKSYSQDLERDLREDQRLAFELAATGCPAFLSKEDYIVQLPHTIVFNNVTAALIQLIEDGYYEQRRDAPEAEARVWSLLKQLATGIDVMHQSTSIIHRDLTPVTCLVVEEPQNGPSTNVTIKITGFMKRLRIPEGLEEEQSRQLPTASLVGYRPPEQVMNETQDEMVDWFSAGVMALEAALGTRATRPLLGSVERRAGYVISAGRRAEEIHSLQDRYRVVLDQALTKLPESDLKKVFHDLTQPDKAARWRSLTAVRQALQAH